MGRRASLIASQPALTTISNPPATPKIEITSPSFRSIPEDKNAKPPRPQSRTYSSEPGPSPRPLSRESDVPLPPRPISQAFVARSPPRVSIPHTDEVDDEWSKAKLTTMSSPWVRAGLSFTRSSGRTGCGAGMGVIWRGVIVVPCVCRERYGVKVYAEIWGWGNWLVEMQLL